MNRRAPPTLRDPAKVGGRTVASAGITRTSVGAGLRIAVRDRNLVFGSRSRTSPSRFGLGAETDFRPALSEFAESPSGCQRRFGLLSLVRARFGLPGGRAGRQESKNGPSPKALWALRRAGRQRLPLPRRASRCRSIGRKRETKGNETGNEQETKRGFLCKNGNGPKMNNENEEGIFRGSSFPLFPPRQWMAGASSLLRPLSLTFAGEFCGSVAFA